MDPTTPCPCLSDRPYAACCGPLHAGTAHAPTAEALMRSRYAAFALGDADYLVRTLHPAKRAPDERQQLQASLKRTEWTGLLITYTEGGTAIDTTGVVAFEAGYNAGGRGGVLRERSNFVRLDGRWVYVDAAI